MWTRSVPHYVLLRARRLCANPQALLPLSLPEARWRTDRARRTSAGFAPCKGAGFGLVDGGDAIPSAQGPGRRQLRCRLVQGDAFPNLQSLRSLQAG